MLLPLQGQQSPEFWSEERTQYILKISEIFRNPDKYDLDTPDIQQTLKSNLKNFLMTLDLRLRVDQRRLAILSGRIFPSNTHFSSENLWPTIFADVLKDFFANCIIPGKELDADKTLVQPIANLLGLDDMTRQIQELITKTMISNE